MQFSQALPGTAAGHRQSAAKAVSDDVLIGLVARNDKDAMRTLFARHHVKVFRFVLRMVNNEATAEDVVNDVFLDVWRHASRFEGRSQVTTWILGIARFKALTALRQHTFDELKDEVAEAIEDLSDTPEVIEHKKQCGAILHECLKELSPAHREVVDLVYYHQQTIEDVAAIIGVPANTAKTRLFYARKHIAQLMAARGVTRDYV
jgi:RNA polymerase sigma-70 factor, ECF subfamily